MSRLGRRARRYPPTVGDIIQDIGEGEGTADKENAQLDSWTVGVGEGWSRRPRRGTSLILESSLSVTSGNGGGSTRASAVTSSFHGVGGMSLSSYEALFLGRFRVAHRHSERPAGLSLTPFDVVSGPSADKHDSRGKIDFPQNIWRKFALTRPPRQPRCPRIIIIIIILCPRGNRFSWLALRGGPSRQSEFIRVGSSREDCYDEFFSASRRGKIGKNSF